MSKQLAGQAKDGGRAQEGLAEADRREQQLVVSDLEISQDGRKLTIRAHSGIEEEDRVSRVFLVATFAVNRLRYHRRKESRLRRRAVDRHDLLLR